MGLSDMLKGAASAALGQIEQQALGAALGSADGAANLQSILAKLQAGGLADQVTSWLTAGRQNLPVTAEQIKQALGDEHVRQIAASLGLPVDKVLEGLQQVLPQAAATQAAASSAAIPAAAGTGTSL